MNIHEYQAKALLKGYGVTVPRGGVAYTPDEAKKVAADLGGPGLGREVADPCGAGRGAGHFADKPAGKGGVRVGEVDRRWSVRTVRKCWAMCW